MRIVLLGRERGGRGRRCGGGLTRARRHRRAAAAAAPPATPSGQLGTPNTLICAVRGPGCASRAPRRVRHRGARGVSWIWEGLVNLETPSRGLSRVVGTKSKSRTAVFEKEAFFFEKAARDPIKTHPVALSMSKFDIDKV